MKKIQIPDNETNLDDDIDLKQLFIEIWQKKFFIILMVVLSTIVGIIILNNSQYKFTVHLKITPVGETSQTNTSKVSNLASLVGIEVGSTTENSFSKYLSLLTSRTVSEEISKDQNFMKDFFYDDWNNDLKKWKERKPTYKRKIINYIKKILGIPIYKKHAPNAISIENYLKGNLVISSDKLSSLTTISIESNDPDRAAIIIEKIHSISDQILKEKSLDRTKSYIKFLENQLSQYTQKDLRESLIMSLSDQNQKLMIASSNLPFIAEPFGKVEKSARHTSPNPRYILFLSSFIGLIIGVFWTLVISKLIKKT